MITVDSDGGDSTFALEYERQPKAANRYWQVRQAIEKERQVRCFLYLTPSYELLFANLRTLGAADIGKVQTALTEIQRMAAPA